MVMRGGAGKKPVDGPFCVGVFGEGSSRCNSKGGKGTAVDSERSLFLNMIGRCVGGPPTSHA